MAVEETETAEDSIAEEDKALDYEMEYILEGKGSERENLEAVAKKLLLLRFAPNYGCILGSAGMRAQAESLALTLCTAAALPMLTGAVTQVLLLAWAFGESIMDLRSLLGGACKDRGKLAASFDRSAYFGDGRGYRRR